MCDPQVKTPAPGWLDGFVTQGPPASRATRTHCPIPAARRAARTPAVTRQRPPPAATRTARIFTQRDHPPDVMAGSTIRRDQPAAKPAGGHHRPCPSPGPLPPQGADLPAPQTVVRAMRDRRDGGSPPGRRTQAPRQTRTGTARVGSPHGTNAAQDAHRLRRVP